jgi:putative IMPACT (imprinted ancient) family translation regulator
MMMIFVLICRSGFRHHPYTKIFKPFIVTAFPSTTLMSYIVKYPVVAARGVQYGIYMAPLDSQPTSFEDRIVDGLKPRSTSKNNNNNQRTQICGYNSGLSNPGRHRILTTRTSALTQKRLQLFSSFSDNKGASSSSSSSSSSESLVTLVPGIRYESELEVKKSRFVAYAQHVADWSEAKMFVEQCKNEHPKARHWCHAYRGVVAATTTTSSIGEVGKHENHDTATMTETEIDSNALVTTERCNDDGEPSGTAGQPILSALQQEHSSDGGLVDVVCVVVRYFGGIKLGAGGLIRAYGGAARQALRESPISRVVPQTTFKIRKIGASAVGIVYDSVAKVGGKTSNESYDAIDGSLTVTVTCDSSIKASLQASLQDATRGSIQFGTP